MYQPVIVFGLIFSEKHETFEFGNHSCCHAWRFHSAFHPNHFSASLFSVSYKMSANDKTDLSTFTGRFFHYLNMTDPRTLIYSDARVKEAKVIVDSYDSVAKTKGQEYHDNKKICDAAFHPVTGEIIPRMFRVSAIAPVNIPLVFLMIACPATNVPGTLFLHWLNQSYNTACNYANRAGADQSIEQTAKVRYSNFNFVCVFSLSIAH